MARHKIKGLLGNRYTITAVSLAAALSIAAVSIGAANATPDPWGGGVWPNEVGASGEAEHFGVNQKVHFANATGQDLYVLAAPNPRFLIADLSVDIAGLLTGVSEMKGAAKASVSLPQTIHTFGDLYKYAKISYHYLNSMRGIGTGTPGTVVDGIDLAHAVDKPDKFKKGAEAFVEEFKGFAKKVSDGEVAEVREQGFMDTWVTPISGWGGMLNAKTVNMLVMTADGNLAEFKTGPDQSWIADKDKIVRSKYGSTWQRNPAEGTVEWGTSS